MIPKTIHYVWVGGKDKPKDIQRCMKTWKKNLKGYVIKEWNESNLQDALNNLLLETGKKPAELFSLIRIAVSFAPFSPALNLTLETLGREVSLARLNAVARSI